MKCNNLYKEIGELLLDARIKKGLTLWELSKLVGQQYNTVKRIEDGCPFLLHHTVWMSEKLDMDIEKILAGVKTKGVTNGRKKTEGKEPQGKIVTENDLI